MPKVSVIVPVYNGEKYLNRCIDSILSQTFTSFELLLINDGSTDKSGEICEEYANKDARVRVFHKKNGGVSSARNVGLDNVNGEWISFIDADDYLYNDSFLVDLDTIKEDIVFTSHKMEYYGEYETFQIERNELGEKSINNFIIKYINSNIIKAPWGKFFRTKIIKDNRFDVNIKVGEDFLFVLEYLKKVNSYYILPDSLYCYIKGEQSLFEKYQQSIEKSIYTLSKLYSAYVDLQIYNPMFERDLFFDYKCLCQNEIDRSPMDWYKDEKVKYIYNRIKINLGRGYRFVYKLLSYKLCSKLWGYIKLYKNG